MEKESIIELQKIDCNCNNCIFMERDTDKFKASLVKHHKWSLDYFNTLKNNIIKKAESWRTRGDIDKCNNLLKEAKKMKFQFNKKEISINYGYCNKLKKDVTFIPNVCQLDTQDCFKHRSEG